MDNDSSKPSGKLQEEDCRTDSGFISGDIDSATLHEEEDEGAPQGMRLDSGVCLSENFSSLSIKGPGLNDLSGKIKGISEVVTPVEEEWPWKQDEDGDTYLHTAIAEGYPEVAEALVRMAPHCRFLDTRNDDGQTPLHLAVETSQPEIARILIVAGARPAPRDMRGDSPLHIAARNGDLKCIKAIMNTVNEKERDALSLSYSPTYPFCDLNQWNCLGQTCLHVAAINGHLEVVRNLVWFGADVNAREGCTGYTALHIAVERMDDQMVTFLLDRKELKAEVRTYGGRNALQLLRTVPKTIQSALMLRGMSPYTSEDDSDSEDDDEEMQYDNIHMRVPLVNASA